MSVFYYLSHQFWSKEGDPRVRNYPLFSGGPQNLLFLMLMYLIFVKIIGPFIMKNRSPYELRKPMFFYNTFMVVLNAYFLYEFIFIIKFGVALLDVKFPDRNDYSETTLRSIRVVYFYYLTKMIDLLDTAFFVLRKKYSQVTILHVYHHFSVPTLGWIVVKIGPLIPGILLFCLLNTTVHVIMYSYYALSAFGPKIHKYLWWKKYITQIQLLQFIILLLYCLIAIPFYTGYRSIYLFIGGSQPPLFLCLFLNFYVRSYKLNLFSRANFKTIIKN